MENALSDREAEVLRLASEGNIDESIAAKMGISISTVRGYWLRIRSKLGAGSRSELVGRYVRDMGDKRQEALDAAQEDAIVAAHVAADRRIAEERALVDEIMKGSAAGRRQLEAFRTISDDETKRDRAEQARDRKQRQEETA